MKRKMKLLIWFTTLCMVLIGVIAISNDAQASESDFVIENGVLTKYTGSGGDVVIPDGVKKIDDLAFRDCANLIKVRISRSVTEIGFGAFLGCTNLTDISIPNSVTKIGENAFYNTSWLENKRQERSDHLVIINNILIDGQKANGNIVIPDRVIKINESAFGGCSSLINIVIPEGITEIEQTAFMGCSNLANVAIPKSVTRIGDCAFGGCDNLTEISFLNPKTVLEYYYTASILDYPDAATEFKNPVITIKGYKGSTAEELFNHHNGEGTRFKFVALDETGGNDMLTTPDNPQKPSEPKTPNKGTTLKSKNVTYKVTKKGSEVAYTKISSMSMRVNIPNTVKIGGISYKVTSVSPNAFKGNKKLSKVAIGANITSIGKNVFSGCKNLKTITIKSTKLKSVGQNAFKGIKSTARIKVPSKQLKAYKKLLKGKGQGKKVRITK